MVIGFVANHVELGVNQYYFVICTANWAIPAAEMYFPSFKVTKGEIILFDK